MADPNTLYAVVSVVFACLAVWVVFMLRTSKEPWAMGPLPNAAPAAAAEVDDSDGEDDDQPAA